MPFISFSVIKTQQRRLSCCLCEGLGSLGV